MSVYLEVNGERIGPLDRAELEARLAKGELPPTARVWMEGWPEWRLLSEAFPSQPASATPTPPMLPPPGNTTPDPGPVAGDWKGLVGCCLSLVGIVLSASLVAAILGALVSRRPTGVEGVEKARLVLAAILFAGALALGIRGLVRGRRTRVMTLAATLSGGAGFLLVMYTSTIAFRLGRVIPPRSLPASSTRTSPSPAPSAEEGPDTGSSAGMEAASAPIKVGAASKTEHDRDRDRIRFFSRNWVEAYQKQGHRDPRWDATALRMLEQWLAIKARFPTNAVKEDLEELADDVLAANCDDPVLLYVCARSQKKKDEAIRLFEESERALKGSPYKGITRFFAVVGISREQREQSRTADVAGPDARALEALKEALGDGSFAPGEEAMIVDVLGDSGWGASFRTRQREAIARAVESEPKVARWVGDLYWGEHHIREAWRRRGGGFADTVKAEGWKGFESELHTAETFLTRAWAAKPDEPFAAAAMMEVMLGLGGATEVRTWFDRAVAAQVDYQPAYTEMLWTLRPRWDGSHAAMLAFGRTALASGRFDTQVPWVFREAAIDVESDARQYNNPVPFRWRDLGGEFKTLYAGFAASPTSSFQGRDWESGLAVACYLKGEFAEARQHLTALASLGGMNEEYLRGWGIDLSLMTQRVAAGASPADLEVKRAEELWEAHRTEEALEAYRQLRKKGVGGDPQASEFLDHRIATLTLERDFQKGGWVDVLPRAGWAGWTRPSGEWSQPKEGGVQVQCRNQDGFAASTVRIGTRWEARGTIEFPELEQGEVTALVSCGLLNPQSRTWTAFRLQHHPSQGNSASYGVRGEPTRLLRRTSVEETNSIELRFIDGAMSVVVNGNPLLTDGHIDRSPVQFSPDSTLGLAAHSAGGELPVVFRKLEVRRIP